METETKTAIVTGASSGIGLGMTQALLERGQVGEREHAAVGAGQVPGEEVESDQLYAGVAHRLKAAV